MQQGNNFFPKTPTGVYELNEKLKVDYVRVERSEIQETREYDLEGLFIRLNHAIDSIGAKRVVLDTIESLFSGLNNTAILRSEIRRLFQWLRIVKYRGSTHGTNEYPFLIDENGVSVLPITSLKLDHTTSTEIISTGLPGLDKLFNGDGFTSFNPTSQSGGSYERRRFSKHRIIFDKIYSSKNQVT